MERFRLPLLYLLYCLCAITPVRAADIAAQCDAAIAKINAKVQAQQYIEAINSAAEYEMMLRSSYPAPTYHDGVFRSAAHHMTFCCPMDDMQLDTMDNSELLQMSKELGVEWLASFSTTDLSDTLNIYAITNVVHERSNDFGSTKATDNRIIFRTKAFFDDVGILSEEQFVMAGPYRILFARLTTSALDPPQLISSLVHGNVLYLFQYCVPDKTLEQNRQDLLDLITSIEWSYCLPNTARIAELREQYQGSIAQTLTCTRELALIGEFNSAAKEAAKLRSMIAAKLPKPYVEDKCAYLPAYNVVLRNPKGAGWRLYVERSEIMETITMEDERSVTPRGITVHAFGLHQLYSDEIVRLMTDPNFDKGLTKDALSSAGRGGLLACSRGPLLSESFTTFHGSLAYQGVVDTTMKHTRMKIVCTYSSLALIVISYFGPEDSFDKDLPYLEDITSNCLTIR
jgi:hypothetical protein